MRLSRKYLPLRNWIVFSIQLITGSIVFSAVNEKAKLAEYPEELLKYKMHRRRNNK